MIFSNVNAKLITVQLLGRRYEIVHASFSSHVKYHRTWKLKVFLLFHDKRYFGDVLNSGSFFPNKGHRLLWTGLLGLALSV